jgi:hypothetical protein
MFDWVKVPDMKCPYCKEGELSGWQTKSGECTLRDVDFWMTDNFYTSCDACNKWVEYQLKKEARPITDYELVDRG